MGGWGITGEKKVLEKQQGFRPSHRLSASVSFRERGQREVRLTLKHCFGSSVFMLCQRAALD